MKKHLVKKVLFLSLVLAAFSHWSCVKDTVTPTSIIVAKKLGIPPNLFSLVVNYHCANCHNPSAGPNLAGVTMDLRTRQSCYEYWVGVSAEILDCSATIRVIPGDAADSMLTHRLDGTGCAVRMPYDGPPYMSASEIQQFTDWINQGANPQ